MANYRKKNSDVKAVQWTGNNLSEVYNLTNGTAYLRDGNIIIKDIRGDRKALKDDWIILDGEFIVRSDYQFNQTYEKIKPQ